MLTNLTHIALSLFATTVIWVLSGILINGTDRVAKRYHKPGFAIAFIILGLMTSISELSVAVSASVLHVPQVSAGNLVGASLVIFLLIIPILAVAGGGIDTRNAMEKRTLFLLILIVIMPCALLLDGEMRPVEGVVMLLAYGSLLFLVQKRKPTEVIAEDAIERVEATLIAHHHATISDISKIATAGLFIFAAGTILVDEALYFSALLHVPASFVGLIALSIGTNVPELVIALRGIMGRHKDIAFGDYLGSAAANTVLLAALPLVNGRFTVEVHEFLATFPVMLLGLILFFFFAISRATLTRREGFVLLSMYALFVIGQAIVATHFNETVEVVAEVLQGAL